MIAGPDLKSERVAIGHGWFAFWTPALVPSILMLAPLAPENEVMFDTTVTPTGAGPWLLPPEVASAELNV
jgi:hypothetical protein